MNSYKIYFGEKPFYITNNLSEDLKQLANADGTLLLNQPERILINKAITEIELNLVAVILLSRDTAHHFEMVRQYFTQIEAGGGLVKNEKDECLFIFRRGKWDLPKGKLDEGESIENCALREVKEETGLQKLSLGKMLLKTWHVYHGFGQHVFKQTTWFDMQAQSVEELIPQTEEDIMEIKWLARDAWPKVLENTFPSIADVLAAV